MTGTKKKPVQTVSKPYLTGSVFDENTVKNVLKYFGMMLLFLVMAFLVCLMTGAGSPILRIIFSSAVILLLLYIWFNQGLNLGTDAVSRGEILYQRQEKGAEMTPNERRLSFHPAKGFVNALLGTIPFLIPAVILAFIAEKQITGVGAIPSYMESVIRQHPELEEAIRETYLKPSPIQASDILRAVVRGMIMPVIRMADTENRELMLTIERLSPLILLCPCVAYGLGYLNGRKERTRVHTRIAENRRIRKRKEMREKKARQAAEKNRKPEQLN